MATETDLLNGALGLFGASTITAIDDGSVNANHCQRFYEPTRRALLRMHHWNFEMARVELAQDVATPAFEFSYQYSLPPSLLKVVEYYGGETDSTNLVGPYTGMPINRYKIEGRKLLTNDGRVLILYLQDIDNPDTWDALFYDVLQLQMASKLSMAITKDTKRGSAFMEQALAMLSIASAVDGQEGSIEPLRSDALTRVR